MSEWTRISEIADVRRGASPRPIGDPRYFGGEVGWVRISDVTRSTRFLRQTEQYVSKLGESLSVRVNPGDLVMSICGTIGRPIIIDIPACIHDGFVRFSNLRNADTTYLFYALQNAELAFNGMGQPGTQTNLNTGLVGSHRIFLPPLPQQRRIAEILGTVDEVIEQTEALIAKQQQVKAGLMHDLFTRGVTATGQLRPPPAEAPHLYHPSPLGPIPKEWNACELRSKLSFISYGFTNPMPEAEEGPYMATAADIHGGRIQYESCRRTTRKAFDQLLTRKSRPIIGDVLLTKDGTLGRIAVVDREDVCINQSVAVLRPQETLHSAFLAALLSSPRWQDKMIADAGGSTIKHIYITVVDRMLIAWPKNQKEIEAITACITEATESIAAETAHLAKLRRQKQGLMHDLLTARVPVVG